ncbi:MAG: hypothetical protein HYZ53_15415, partial [Planctomycetes bacterium]|nr:hypothetical protein [Planctomycetota bacterium]
MRFLLDNFEKHKEEGLTAWRSGEAKEARYHFLKAAEYLFRLAEKTDGDLRGVRIKNAEELVAWARRIGSGKAGRPPGGGAGGAAAGAGGPGGPGGGGP